MDEGSSQRSLPVPLLDVKVFVTIFDFCGHVAITQRYFNAEDSALEVVYTMPMDPKAAVNGLSVHIDDRTVYGEVQEKQQARKTYQQALRHGDGAYLLEESQESPDVFTMRVGSLPAKKEVCMCVCVSSFLSLQVPCRSVLLLLLFLLLQRLPVPAPGCRRK